MGNARVCALSYESGHSGLREAVKEMVSAARSNSGEKFRTYRPTGGKSDVAIVIFPQPQGYGGSSNTAALAQSKGEDEAMALLQRARSGVKSLQHRQVSHEGTGFSEPPAYLGVLSVEYDPAQADQVRSAGQAILNAHQQANSKLNFSVVKPDDAQGRFLVVVGADSTGDLEALNEERPQVAGAFQAFHKAVNKIEYVSLRYDAELSNA